VLCYKLKSYLY